MADALQKFFVELPAENLMAFFARLIASRAMSDDCLSTLMGAVAEIRPDFDQLLDDPKWLAAMKLLVARWEEIGPPLHDDKAAIQRLVARVQAMEAGESWHG